MNTVPTHRVEDENSLIWGNLKDFHVPDLLVYLHWARKTGILYITRERVKKHVYIRDGIPLAARSNMKSELMGEFLVSKEIITMEQQQRVIELQKSTDLTFGDILLQQEMITKKDLFVQARRQFLSILFSLFGLNEGFYKFKEEDFPPNLYSFKVTFSNLMVFGIRQIADSRVVKEMMGSTSHIPVHAERFSDYRKIMFVDKELAVIKEVDGSKTIQEIINTSSEQPITCMKTLLILLHHGLIQVKVDFRDEEINQIVDLEQSAAASLGFDSYQSEDAEGETAVAGNDFLNSPPEKSFFGPKDESPRQSLATSEPDQTDPVETLSPEENDLIQNVFKPFDAEVDDKAVLHDETSEHSDSEREEDHTGTETPLSVEHGWTEEEIESADAQESSPESASTELIEAKPSPLDEALAEVPSVAPVEFDLSESGPSETEQPSSEAPLSDYLEEEVRSAAESAWFEDASGVEKDAAEAKTEDEVSVFTSGEVLDPSPQSDDEVSDVLVLSGHDDFDSQEEGLTEETDSGTIHLEEGDLEAATAWTEDVPGVEAKTEDEVSVFTSGEGFDSSPQSDDEVPDVLVLSGHDDIDYQEERLAEETDSEIIDLEGGEIDTVFPSQEDEDQKEVETSDHEDASSLPETTMNLESIMQEESEEEEGPFARAYKVRIDSEKIEAEEEEVDQFEESTDNLKYNTHDSSETEEKEGVHNTETPEKESLESILKNDGSMDGFENPADVFHETGTEKHDAFQKSREADAPNHPVLKIFDKDKETKDEQESETADFTRQKNKKRRFGFGYAAALVLVIGYGLFSLSPWKSTFQDRLFNTYGTEPVQLAQNIGQAKRLPEKVITAEPEIVSLRADANDHVSSIRQDRGAVVGGAIPIPAAPSDAVKETVNVAGTEKMAKVPAGTVTNVPVKPAAPVETAAAPPADAVKETATIAESRNKAEVPAGTVTNEPVKPAAPIETAVAAPVGQERAAMTASNVVAQPLPTETSQPLPQASPPEMTAAPVLENAGAQTKPIETAEVVPQVQKPQDTAVIAVSDPIALAEPSKAADTQPDVSQPSETVAQTPADPWKAQMAQWTDRLRNIPSTKYTIQVEISSKLTNVRNDWDRLEGYDAMVVGFKVKDWSAYTLLVGTFDSRQEGNEAVKNLPAYILKAGPLVKTMNTIHKGLVSVE